MSARRSTLLHLALLCLLCLALYARSLTYPLLWDELEFLRDNPVVTSLEHYASPSTAPTYQHVRMLGTRYLGYLSFALNYHAHGLSPVGYHIVNIAIHMINCLLLYALLRLSLSAPALRSLALPEGRRGLVALLAALLFAAHPLATEAVTYVFQRMASLAALFCLASATTYALHLRREGKTRWAWYALSVLSALAAMKTKEIAFTLPVLLVLYDLTLHEGALKARALRLAPFLLLMSVIPLSMAGSGAASMATSYLSLKTGYEEYSAADYLITQSRVIVTYLRLILLPFNQNLDYDYPLYRTVLSVPVMASLALIIAMIGSALYLMTQRGVPAWARLAGLGVVWFFVALSVESSVVPLPMLMDEYRVYLPLAGVMLAVSALLMRAMDAYGERTVLLASMVLVALFWVAAYERNAVWADPVSLWSDVVKKSPDKLRGYNNLGNAYSRAGQHEEARGVYLRALEKAGGRRDRHEAAVHYNLAMESTQMGQPVEAIRHYRMAVAITPGDADAHNNLGLVYQGLGRYAEAEAAYRAALGAEPGYAPALFNLGEACYLAGGRGQCAEYFERYLAKEPRHSEACRYLGMIEAEAENYKRLCK